MEWGFKMSEKEYKCSVCGTRKLKIEGSMSLKGEIKGKTLSWDWNRTNPIAITLITCIVCERSWEPLSEHIVE